MAAATSSQLPRSGVWWAPRRLGWWTGVLFAIGSTCFLVGPFPGFVELVGSEVDGAVFFAGSIFFTSASLLQYLDTVNARRDGAFSVVAFEWRRLDWWSCVVQLAGTLFFNVSTFNAMDAGLDATQYDKLVWTPDLRGSICFLVAGACACLDVRRRATGRTLGWWIAWVNMVGCIAFGVSAVAAYVVPSTGDALDLAAANAWTSFGALCFLVGAVLLLPESAD